MGIGIHFKRPDGKTAAAYLARAGLDHPPGIVVLPEWWGLQDQIKAMCDRFAANGYDAIAPDFYAGRVIAYHDNAAAAQEMNSLNFLDAVDQTVRGAVLFLAQANKQVGVAGFCMGGAMTVLSATRISELSAAISFYGLPEAKAAAPAAIKVPLQGHFSLQDDWCTPELVDQFEKGLTAAHNPYEFYRYEAGHAFMNEQRLEAYNRSIAELAWERSLKFLQQHLQG